MDGRLDFSTGRVDTLYFERARCILIRYLCAYRNELKMSEEPSVSKQEWPLRKRVYSGAIIIAFSVFLGYLSVEMLWAVWPLKPGMAWLQVPLLITEFLLLALAAYIVWTSIRRKLTTGRFFYSPDEAARRREEIAHELGAGKPLMPQVWLWLLPCLLTGMLLSFGIGMTVTLYASSVRILGFVLGASLVCCGLVYPFIAIRRKWRTGSFLPSQEELAKRRARCGKPRSLAQRATLAGVWILMAIFWTDTAISRMHSQHHGGIFPPWMLILVGWMNAGIFTWQLFKPSASCALTVAPAESPNSTDDGSPGV